MDPFLSQLLAYQQAQGHSHPRPKKAAYSRYPGYYNYGNVPYGAYDVVGGGYPRGYVPRRGYGGYNESPALFYSQPAYHSAGRVPSEYYDQDEDEDVDDYDEDEDVEGNEEENEDEDDSSAPSAAVPAGLSSFGLGGGNEIGEEDGDEAEGITGSTPSGYQFLRFPTKGASGYPKSVIYFTKPKAKQRSAAVPYDYSELAQPESTASIPAESAFRSFDPSSVTTKNKRQRQQKQPMYIMDRYGNLYPYQPTPAVATASYPNEKKEIDANQLIRMLLGADDQKDGEVENKKPEESEKPAAGDDEDEKERTLEAAAISKAINDELEAEAKFAKEQEQNQGPKDAESATSKVAEETPLTREGLAEILSQLANSEEQKPSVIPPPVAEAAGIPAPPPVIPIPQKLRRRSTAPSLNVHKADKTVDEPSSSSKPTVVADVKVSAPQLKKKNLPFSPPLNVYEFKTKYIVVISLPGVSKEFVEIDYHPTSNELVIKGEAKNKYLSDDDEAANSFVLKVSEQRFGNFERIVKLPAYPGIEDTQIKAKFLNGLLEIKLPKVDESKLQKEAKKIVLEDVPDEELERESGKGYI